MQRYCWSRHPCECARRILVSWAALAGFLLIAVQPVLAAGSIRLPPAIGQKPVVLGLLDGLGNIIVGALKKVLRVLFNPIRSVIEKHGDALLRVVIETPHPDAAFSAPSNEPWSIIYSYYWETLVPLTLSLYGLAIGLVILLESTSHLFSNYHRTKLKKRAFSGLLGILSWWWIAALSLRFIDALAIALVPSLSEISLFQTVSFSGIGVIGLVITMITDLGLFMLIGLIYLMRRLILFLFVLLMPILIVFWIPGVGPFALASKFMRRLAGFYVPFLFMTIPVALLLRLGDLLGQSADFSATGIGSWLTALVIPFVAVLSPFVLFWQAGVLLYLGDRTSRHMSAQRARDRVSRGGNRIRQIGRGSRNFVRGIRHKPAVRADGQTMLASGNSRAHTTAKRVKRAGNRLRGAFSGRENGGDGGGGNTGTRTDDSSDRSSGNESSSDSASTDQPLGLFADPDPGDAESASDEVPTDDSNSRGNKGVSHWTRRDELRDARQSSRDRDSTYIDDDPRYLQ